MKNLIFTAKCLLIALIFTNLPTKTVMAQFSDPITADISATQGAGGIISRNTGNDIMEFVFGTGDEISVSVWDDANGNNAAFSWEETANNQSGTQILDGTNYGTVRDPDIILSREGYRVFIVYELHLDAADVFYEGWTYNPGTNSWSLAFGSTQLNTVSPASNPNIDGIGVYDFEMVAVWEQDGGEIWAEAGDYVNGFGSYSPIFIGHSAPAMWPDVSLYYNPTQGHVIVNFVYIEDVTTAWALWQQWEYLTDIQGNSVNVNQNGLYVAYANELGRPRISSNPNLGDDDSNYAIAVRYLYPTNSEYYIYTFTRCGNTSYGPNIINDNSPDLTSSSSCFVNDEPAIAHVGDYLLVVWTYDDNCFGYHWSDLDVIQKRCSPCNGTSATTEYLVVNDYPSTAGDHSIPSVAGRHSPNYNALYTFWYKDITDVFYKWSNFSNSPIRIMNYTEAQSNDIIIYPNPTNSIINIDSKKQNISTIIIKDITGKILLIEKSKIEFNQIDLTGFDKGTYLMEINFVNANPETFKIQIVN